MKMRFWVAVLLGTALVISWSNDASAQRTKLTVYTSMEAHQLAPFKTAIEASVSDIEISWLRDATGVITARVIAEKDNPKADVVYALAASSLMLFKKIGLLETYKAKNADKLKASFRSTDDTWIGHDAFLGVVCYNTIEGQKAGLTPPKSWKDLLDRKYKGAVVMSHPVSSGTGYMTIAAWMAIMGEAEAWKYMDALHENVAVYTHSGSAPCVAAAKGERTIGISFDMRAATEKSNGAPLDIISPSEGIGWDMEATAIIKGTKNLDAAQKLMNWAASKEANELHAKYYAIVAHPEVKNLPTNYPADAEARMAKINFETMANDRERILAEWVKRFEAKAAPKK